jgi:hypothetical protein
MMLIISLGERMVRMLVDKSEEQQRLLDEYAQRDEVILEIKAEREQACQKAEMAHLDVKVCHSLLGFTFQTSVVSTLCSSVCYS